MRINRETILVSTDNQAVVADGVALVNTANKEYNVAEGQIGFFDAETKLAVDATSILDSGKIIIVRGNGGSASSARSTSVRTSTGEEFSACDVDKITATPYNAGTDKTVNFLFNCTDCGNDYTIKLGINNPDFNMYFPNNQENFETITVRSEDCPTCDGDCDYTHSCSELVTKFVDEIEANTQLMTFIDSVAAIAGNDAIFDTYTEYSCGIRIVFKTAERECGCFPPAEHSIHKFVIPTLKLGSGFTSQNSVITYTGTVELEEGNGDKLIWREYKAGTGGMGMAYRPGLTNSGHPYYAQRKDSASKLLTVDCEEDYCQYVLSYKTKASGTGASENIISTNLVTIVAVPQGDTATQGDVEDILNAWFNSKACAPDISITCD
jgi:hypothetical protein